MDLVELGSILEIDKGKKPSKQTKEPRDGFLPYVDIDAFENGTIKSYANGTKCTPCEDGDILIVCDGSRSGLVGKAVKGYVGSTLAKITARGLTSDYLFYFVQGKYSLLNSRKKGTGTPHLDQELLKKQKIVVPDRTEQERIVARIEELFSQLDAGVDMLNRIKAQLEMYRQAVLKEAFEGRLTDSKRLSIDRLRDHIEKPRYGTSKKCNYENGTDQTAVYRIPNINYSIGRINHEDIKYARIEENEMNGLSLQQGDILVIRSNGSISLVGRAAIVHDIDIAGTYAGYLIRIRIKNTNKLLPKYLLLYLQSYQARCYIEDKAKSTSGVHNINSNEISDLQIPLYNYEDQLAIVEAIESRFSACNSIEQTIEHALEQAESLRLCILRNAFEEGI